MIIKTTILNRISRRPHRVFRYTVYAISLIALALAPKYPAVTVFFPLAFGVPVFLGSWWDGRRAGYPLALLSTATGLFTTTPLHLFIRVITLFFVVEALSRTAEMSRRLRVLEGLLSMCFSCQRIRDDKGEWVALERYLLRYSEAAILHTYCPDCADTANLENPA